VSYVKMFMLRLFIGYVVYAVIGNVVCSHAMIMILMNFKTRHKVFSMHEFMCSLKSIAVVS